MTSGARFAWWTVLICNLVVVGTILDMGYNHRERLGVIFIAGVFGFLGTLGVRWPKDA